MRPVDHERPASAVEMSGEKVSSWEGRTPTSSDWPAGARTSPPLVAVAVAWTLLDQVRKPSRRKNSCQNVLAGCARLPIGTVAQVPPPPSTEVARGVGREGAACPPGAARGALAPHEARQTAASASPAVALAAGPLVTRAPTGSPGPVHRVRSTVLMFAARATATEAWVAFVAGPGSVSMS